MKKDGNVKNLDTLERERERERESYSLEDKNRLFCMRFQNVNNIENIRTCKTYMLFVSNWDIPCEARVSQLTQSV